MTAQTKMNAQEKHPAVLDGVPATALDGPAGTGAIAIFYGAARYPFELARQRELVEDYADTAGLNLVTEFHDRQQRQHGLKMLLDACQRGGVEYVITAGWPTPNLTTTEADAVLEQLTASGTHLACLKAWHPGDGTPPAWWNDKEGAQIRQLDELREQERQQHEQTSETGADSQVNQASRTGNASQSIEPSKEVHHA
ncbi:recombinase family protein [Actinomyces naeslundii]|uniref:recombinase family protein n=1 Tax=Actinomyces naeslundii TaxID=1655 RepID=UPI002116F6F1|nr:recombinase family protein [Actinomyces naeslundii]